MPFASKRVFPTEWLDAGDDRDRLREIAKKRRALDGPRPDALLRRRWGRATTEIAGRELHLLTPPAGSTGRVLFYCHGGAFVVGPSSLEWLFAAKVAGALGCDLALYDYPKVPETDSTQTLEATRSAWREISFRYAPEHKLIAGMSAGGGLAVATMLQLGRSGADLPAAAALFSPWLDMTISHPEVDQFLESEKLLPIEQLRRDGQLYAGKTTATDPLVSPRFATADELSKLPPVVVTAGELEILLPEAREFVDNLAASAVEAKLLVEPYGQHAGVVGPAPEAAGVLAEATNFLKRYI